MDNERYRVGCRVLFDLLIVSVRLEPAKVQKEMETKDSEDIADYWSIDMSNGTWSRMTALLTKEERELKWNGCHDGQFYNPTQLSLIASRLEGQDREYFAEALIDMAGDGGAVVC